MRHRRYRIERRGGSNSEDPGLGFVPLLRHDNRAKVDVMGHSRGRDNAKKRAKRRKKSERLALAKQPSREAPARQGKRNAANLA